MIGADRPYVDRPVIDRVRAEQAAADAAAAWKLHIDRSPVRAGMNVVYAAGPAVLRVGHTTAPGRAALELSANLGAAGIPVAPSFDGLAADVGDLTVTAWQRVRATRRAIDYRAVGAAIRVLHELAPHLIPQAYPVVDPLQLPWWDLQSMLDAVKPSIDDNAYDGLQRHIDHALPELKAVADDPVLCHGDLQPANILSSNPGPLLIDWDLMCWAHPVWDHAFLISAVTRWGGDPRWYRAFAAGYGRSYHDDPFAHTVARTRDAVATLMLVRAEVGQPNPGSMRRAEMERRLAFWAGDESITFSPL